MQRFQRISIQRTKQLQFTFSNQNKRWMSSHFNRQSSFYATGAAMTTLIVFSYGISVYYRYNRVQEKSKKPSKMDTNIDTTFVDSVIQYNIKNISPKHNRKKVEKQTQKYKRSVLKMNKNIIQYDNNTLEKMLNEHISKTYAYSCAYSWIKTVNSSNSLHEILNIETNKLLSDLEVYDYNILECRDKFKTSANQIENNLIKIRKNEHFKVDQWILFEFVNTSGDNDQESMMIEDVDIYVAACNDQCEMHIFQIFHYE
eukprot:439386_1